MRLIDADVLYNGAMKDEYFRFKEKDKSGREAFAYSCAMQRLVEAPTIQPEEPRVMTLEEANAFEVVWVEDRSTNTVFPCLVKNNMNDSKLYKHGIQWRVWSARPTEEQREGVKWDG